MNLSTFVLHLLKQNPKIKFRNVQKWDRLIYQIENVVVKIYTFKKRSVDVQRGNGGDIWSMCFLLVTADERGSGAPGGCGSFPRGE